ALILAGAHFSLIFAAADGTSDIGAADAQILAQVHEHTELMPNLEYLSDNIGARLTGSAQLKQANDWTADLFRKYGLSNVHLEPWTIAHSWTRGTASARIIAPTEHPLTIAAAGWSPSTLGVLRGPVVFVDAKKKEDLEKFHGKLKGAMVVYQEPESLSPPPVSDPNAVRPMQAPPAWPGQPPAPSPFAAQTEFARARNAFFQQEGVGAILRDSNKPHGLLNMTGIGGEKFEIGAVPTAFITGEGYRMIFRMMKHGPVQLEISMTNTFSDKPVEVYNTVAEIRGSEKPDEVVILGAHLDSWDLGTGSTDNGTGSMAVMEAARALVKSGLQPKRTIRFILFGGEEEGLCGSVKYVEAHKNDLDKISGVLVHDTGTGRVLSIGLHDNYQDREIVDRVIAPLHDLKLREATMLRQGGTDHKSFDDVGVPGFWTVQDRAEYPQTHHSQTDTFDKVWKDDINQGAQVLAAWAYNTAQLPAMLPRRPVPPTAPTNSADAAPAAAPADPVAEMDTKILAQVKADEAILKSNLEYLADRIGPRLTGSQQLDRASHWSEERFKEAGYANAHLEGWQIANNWVRGPATAHTTTPVEQNLTLATAGRSPGTSGPLHGQVVGLDVKTEADIEQYKGKLQGAIVLLGKPVEMVAPGNPMLVPWGDETIPVALPKADKPIDYAAYFKTRRAQVKLLEAEHVGAIIIGSEKWYGLMNMSISSMDYLPGKAPTAYMARENYTLLWRLLESGPVEAEINLQGNFTAKNVDVYNTVAEIRGTEKPDEVVIIGGHLDSWDLGTGATDNGTGSMAVLEAARALQKLGVKPKRTIRFVLFTGEEQGVNGSKAYIKAHKEELAKISGVLIDDSGTGKVLTVGLMANYNVRETMDHVLYPLARGVGLAEPTLRVEGGSDHVPFDEAGVPAFWCVQDGVDYDKTHHSQADTLDRVRWDDLTEGAQVLAVFAYNVAQLPEMLPRKPAKPAAPKE
ncbi:MAG TPA: M20/M25/M40 family metallo-hydrolase, partial [Candidatus Dormibacteraeota bacterium]|nr:M20/M25/M40 family metallo-hydrolase [Candidatus Dormibacteraeota bacterium]